MRVIRTSKQKCRCNMKLALIAAMDRNRAIGLDNDLPWRLPDDLKFFKAQTLGCPIVMGRKTWDSLGRPLPGRRNVVLSRQVDLELVGADSCSSVAEVMDLLANEDKVFVIGGAEIYSLFLDAADELVLTLVETEVEADVWFPEWEKNIYREVSSEHHPADERHPFAFHHVVLEKR